MTLLGLPLGAAREKLDAAGVRYEVVRYASQKPPEGARDTRVVRVRETGGIVELLVCEFKTELGKH